MQVILGVPRVKGAGLLPYGTIVFYRSPPHKPLPFTLLDQEAIHGQAFRTCVFLLGTRSATYQLRHPRDPQGHRAPRSHFVRWRPAGARRLPGRSGTCCIRQGIGHQRPRGPAIRPDRRLCAAAPMGCRRPEPRRRQCRRRPDPDCLGFAASAGPAGQGTDRQGQQGPRRRPQLPGRAAVLQPLSAQVRAGAHRRRRPDPGSHHP